MSRLCSVGTIGDKAGNKANPPSFSYLDYHYSPNWVPLISFQWLSRFILAFKGRPECR